MVRYDVFSGIRSIHTLAVISFERMFAVGWPLCLELTLFIIKILQFSNSFVNAIINPFRIPEFKRTLFQILNFCVIPFGRFSNEVSPSAGPGHFHHPTFTRKVRFYLLTFWSSFSLRQLQIEPSRTAVIQRVSVF